MLLLLRIIVIQQNIHNAIIVIIITSSKIVYRRLSALCRQECGDEVCIVLVSSESLFERIIDIADHK